MTAPTALPMRLLKLLGSLRLTVVGLFVLLVLTIWGTVYQVENGLYQAQQKFYGSWYFLELGFLPVPGAKLVMTVMFVNMLAAGLSLALARRLQAGLALTHGGLLLMLAAGAVTFYLGEEAHLGLIEGGKSNSAQNARAWELAVAEAPSAPEREVSARPVDGLAAGQALPFPGGAFTVQVDEVLPHAGANALPAGAPKPAYRNDHGVAEVFAEPKPKEPEDLRPALKLTIRAKDQEEKIMLWGGDDVPTVVEVGGKKMAFELRVRHIPLPATIELVDFRKEMHPGTEMARVYSSDVIVRPAQGAERKVHISMNKPLRLDSFTFYQSSYKVLGDGREVSIFAVVKNYGRTMPYIATFLTAFGMLVHFGGRLLLRIQRNRNREARS